MVKNPYEALIPLKRIPYWLYWLVLGWIVYVPLGQIIGVVYGKNHLLIARIIAAFAFPLLIMLYIWLHKGYGKVMLGLSNILWQDETECINWIYQHEENIFTFKKLPAKIFTGLVLIATVTTVAISDLNFVSVSHRVYLILWGIPILFVCSHGCYILVALLANLYQIVRRPAKVPFFMLPHPAISELQNYFSKGASAVTVLYILLVIAFYDTFQTELVGVIWLSVLGLYPLSDFLFSITQVHELMKNIKQNQYESISEEVDKALNTSLGSNDHEKFSHLDKLMDIQKKVHSMPEWPINFQGIFTFVFSLLAAVTQIVISFLSQ